MLQNNARNTLTASRGGSNLPHKASKRLHAGIMLRLISKNGLCRVVVRSGVFLLNSHKPSVPTESEEIDENES